MDNFDGRFEMIYTAGLPKLRVKNIDPTEDPFEVVDEYSRDVFGVRLMALPAFRPFNLIDSMQGPA